jgi:hypothetical protein
LWHGNTFQALNKLESLEMDLEAAAYESKNDNTRKLLNGVEELHTYVERNQSSCPTTESAIATGNGSRLALWSRQ